MLFASVVTAAYKLHLMVVGRQGLVLVAEGLLQSLSVKKREIPDLLLGALEACLQVLSLLNLEAHVRKVEGWTESHIVVLLGGLKSLQFVRGLLLDHPEARGASVVHDCLDWG